MQTNDIRIFQVDEWAYVAARSPDEAVACVDADTGRPDDVEEQDMKEITPNPNLVALLGRHIAVGGAIPAIIAIDGHYA